MDYHRAVQLYLWSLPIVGQAQWRQSYFDMYDMQPNQYVYAKEFNDRSLILTANESTPYLFGWINVKDKAAILEVPPGPLQRGDVSEQRLAYFDEIHASTSGTVI